MGFPHPKKFKARDNRPSQTEQTASPASAPAIEPPLVEWGRTLGYVSRGEDRRLRLSVESPRGYEIIVGCWWFRNDSGWYPDRRKCLVLMPNELPQVLELLAKATT